MNKLYADTSAYITLTAGNSLFDLNGKEQMKHLPRLSLTLLCASIASVSFAEEVTEMFTAPSPTQYCVEQTSVRGSYSNLVIDHNLIVAPKDTLKSGDVFIGVRFQSRPGELWLLSSDGGWRKINGDADLANAQYVEYEQLPLVVPVSAFYDPTDISAAIGDGQIWVGYGLSGEAGTPQDSFAEMVESHRYNLIWEAPNSLNEAPRGGIRNIVATLCFNTSTVVRVSDQFTVDTQPIRGGDGPELSVDPITAIPPIRDAEGPTLSVDPITAIPPIRDAEGPTLSVDPIALDTQPIGGGDVPPLHE